MYFDIGVYGVSGVVKRGLPWWAPDAVAKFEEWMIGHHSYSALYAIVELDRHRFEQMFDLQLYRDMKHTWDPNARLMDLFDKVRRHQPTL